MLANARTDQSIPLKGGCPIIRQIAQYSIRVNSNFSAGEMLNWYLFITHCWSEVFPSSFSISIIPDSGFQTPDSGFRIFWSPSSHSCISFRALPRKSACCVSWFCQIVQFTNCTHNTFINDLNWTRFSVLLTRVTRGFNGVSIHQPPAVQDWETVTVNLSNEDDTGRRLVTLRSDSLHI